MQKQIVFLPGLGFTPEVFKNISLSVGERYYLNWIVPRPSEPMSSYGRRMIGQLGNRGGELILIGHSFGGIMAQEIAALVPVQKIVLISSIRSRVENPWKFRVVKSIGLQHFFTKEGARRTLPYWGRFLGYETKEERALFLRMIDSQSNEYLKWALVQLSQWQGSPYADVPLLQIHGTADRTFPYRLIEKPDITIPKGNHNLVYNRGNELKPYIEAFIKEPTF